MSHASARSHHSIPAMDGRIIWRCVLTELPAHMSRTHFTYPMLSAKPRESAVGIGDQSRTDRANFSLWKNLGGPRRQRV